LFWNEARESGASRLADSIAFWAVAAFCIFLVFSSTWIPAVRKLRALSREEGRIKQEICTLGNENARLACRLDAMYCSSYYLERVLRKEHGFLRKGEQILESGPRQLANHGARGTGK
jgi:hypothetical protein